MRLQGAGMMGAEERCRAAMSTHAGHGIQRVVVVGAGLMGAGITQVSIHNGFDVTMIDTTPELVGKGVDRISKSLSRVLKKSHPDNVDKATEEIMARLKTGSDPVAAVAAGADLVIEAIPEKLPLKRRLFESLDPVAPAHTIFASNTSSLRIADIFATVSAARQDKQIGLHFFSPVPVMKLVEVIRADKTSQDTYERAFAYAKKVRVPITCKDVDGFVVNRLLVPYMLEAVRMLERGDANVADIDTAMVLGAGYPMGPLTLADYVGLDTTAYIIDGWSKKYPDNPLFAPSPLLSKMVADGHLGVKSGKGFYQYNPDGSKKQ